MEDFGSLQDIEEVEEEEEGEEADESAYSSSQWCHSSSLYDCLAART